MKKGSRMLAYAFAAVIALIVAGMAASAMSKVTDKAESLTNTSAYEEALKAARGQQ